MASKSLGTLTVDLVAKIGGFTKGMTQAERQTEKSARAMEARMKKLGKSLDAAFAVAAAAFAALGTAAAVGIGRAVDRMDDIGKASQKVGIATDELSKLAYAAELADVNFEQLQGGLIKLAKAQDAANQGTGAQLELFRALGVEFKNADGTLRNTADVFEDLADQFQALPDGADKTAAALTLFGKSGAALIPLLNDGSDAIREAGDELERLGGVVTPEAAKAAEDYNDNVTRLNTALDGLWQAVAADLLPDMVKLTEELVDGSKSGNEFAATAENIANGIRGVVFIADKGFQAIKGLTLALVDLGSTAANFLATYTIPGRLAVSDEQRQALRDISAVTGAGANEAADSFLGRGGNAAPAFDWEAGEMAAEEYAKQSRLALDADAKAAAVAAALADERGRAGRESAAKAAADKAAADAARELERADAELQKRLEELTKAGIDYRASLDSLEAQLAGPLAEAELEHVRRMEETQTLLDSGAITVEDATRAQMLYGEAIKKTRDELDPYGKELRLLLEDMAFEYDLMGKTNAERIVELELRRLGLDMATKEGQAAAEAIRAQVEALEQRQELISQMDQFRSSFEDNVAAVLDGSKSIKDAVKDMLADLSAQFARMIAQQWGEKLFGEMGSAGTGSAGGWLSSIFSAFTAKAVGGPVMSGVPYLVGEQGPELVVPNAAGTVIPAGKTAAMLGGTTNVTFVLPGRNDLRSEQQRQADLARVTGRQLARGTA